MPRPRFKNCSRATSKSTSASSTTRPGAWGTFPWADRKRNLHGVIFTYVPLTQGGFQAVLDTQLAVLRETRNIIDNNLIVP